VKWILAVLGSAAVLFVVIVAAIRYAHHLQVNEAKAEATDKIQEIARSEKSAARANMQTIANANQSHKLMTGKYATVITDLYGADADLVFGITGPGARTYALVSAGRNCDHDGDAETAPVAVPAGNFGVQSSVETDGCFIPGLSPR
jgi:hypothetical protein